MVSTGTVIGRVVGYQHIAEKLGSLTFTEIDEYKMLPKINTVKKAENETTWKASQYEMFDGEQSFTRAQL